MKGLVINRHWPAYSEEVAREFIGEMGAITAEEALRRAPAKRRGGTVGAKQRPRPAEADEKRAA